MSETLPSFRLGIRRAGIVAIVGLLLIGALPAEAQWRGGGGQGGGGFRGGPGAGFRGPGFGFRGPGFGFHGPGFGFR
ncbi:MAG: hypothetical protein J2P47_14590, partial [Acetobacteraceae bacterium]|nr:hypothetical protein [Acetobacteraceae bacterium]